jgi:hypothetical protein
MTKQETFELYSRTFPTAENPLTYSEIFSSNQLVDFASLAIEAGEPLEFELVGEDDLSFCDGIVCKLDGEILIPK